MARRKITLASALPRPVPPPPPEEPVRVRVSRGDDHAAIASAFERDIDGNRSPNYARDALTRYRAEREETRDDWEANAIERADQEVAEFRAAHTVSQNCPTCYGFGYNMQEIRSARVFPMQAMPCRNPNCEMGKVARAMHALRQQVRRRG